MDDATRTTCELFIQNRDLVKNVFRFNENLTHTACSSIYTMRGKTIDPESMKASKKLIQDHVGIFNNFRGTVFSCVTAMIDSSGAPEDTLEHGLGVYKLLKEEFFASEYLALAAMSIAQLAEPGDYERLAGKTRDIYDRMKAQHWFRTSSEDTGLCAILALSEKSAEQLIDTAEQCYAILKPSFFSGDAVQSLSHVLALGNADPREACEKTMALYTKLKDAGHKYGTYYELASLGVLAMSAPDFETVVPQIIEIDDWLSRQKGFGIMSTVTKKQRLMYAGMIAVKDVQADPIFQNSAMTSMVSMMVMQEVALYAGVSSGIAAGSMASSSN